MHIPGRAFSIGFFAMVPVLSCTGNKGLPYQRVDAESESDMLANTFDADRDTSPSGDASAEVFVDPMDASNPLCGNGIVDPDEECDLGDRNGVKLDTNFQPTDSAEGRVYCSLACTIPPCHCVF